MEEKSRGESKGKREEGNGLYQTGRWSTSRFFLSSPTFFNHLSSSLPLRPRTLLNCLPLVFTPVPLRYGLSSEEALRDIYSAARVGRIKTGRNEGKKEKRNARRYLARSRREAGAKLARNVSFADKVDSRARYRRLAYRCRLFPIAAMIYLPHRPSHRSHACVTGNHEQTILTSVTFEFVTKRV